MGRIAVCLSFLLLTVLMAQPPQKHTHAEKTGLTLVDNDAYSVKLGAHMNGYYSYAEGEGSQFAINQSGVMVYGHIAQKVRYLAEVGAEDLYAFDADRGDSSGNDLILNRLYVDYLAAEAFNIRAGQFLTPIGIYNPAYIGALRWTTVTPFVAEGFFPKIIAGIDINGKLGASLNVEYDLFYHVSGEHDQNPNAVRASEFAGGEVRYTFGIDGKIAIPFGRFRSDSSREICRFAGANFLWPLGRSQLSGELLYKNGSWNETTWEKQRRWDELAWYLQYVQSLAAQHFATIRYGYNDRSENGWHTQQNVVAGYVYRPQNNLSFKVEYQYFQQEAPEDNYSSHNGYLSVGVLF